MCIFGRFLISYLCTDIEACTSVNHLCTRHFEHTVALCDVNIKHAISLRNKKVRLVLIVTGEEDNAFTE